MTQGEMESHVSFSPSWVMIFCWSDILTARYLTRPSSSESWVKRKKNLEQGICLRRVALMAVSVVRRSTKPDSAVRRRRLRQHGWPEDTLYLRARASQFLPVHFQ